MNENLSPRPPATPGDKDPKAPAPTERLSIIRSREVPFAGRTQEAHLDELRTSQRLDIKTDDKTYSVIRGKDGLYVRISPDTEYRKILYIHTKGRMALPGKINNVVNHGIEIEITLAPEPGSRLTPEPIFTSKVHEFELLTLG